MDYIAAGFAPDGFWRLTPRLYDLHMRGALARIEREIEISNRQAYNTAALAGAAFAGKLEAFERVFPHRLRGAGEQSPDVQEAMIIALGAAMGADLSEIGT